MGVKPPWLEERKICFWKQRFKTHVNVKKYKYLTMFLKIKTIPLKLLIFC